MANGLIPDPYYGTNEDSVQWVSGRAWVYTTRVLKKDLRKTGHNTLCSRAWQARPN